MPRRMTSLGTRFSPLVSNSDNGYKTNGVHQQVLR